MTVAYPDPSAEQIAAEVKDLANGPVNPPVKYKLDSFVDLLAEEAECASMEKWWHDRREAIKSRIKDVLGDKTVGTVNGEDVVTFEYQNRFRTDDFRKLYPNMYEAYSREFTERKLDIELLKQKRPDLFREFQVRGFKNSYRAPGTE